MILDNLNDYYERLNSYEKTIKKMKPRFKDVCINGEKTDYQICNNGQLINTKNYHVFSASHKNKLNDEINRYKRVTIYHKGKEYKFQLHRLVAEYFCNIPDRLKDKYTIDELQVNHINGIKTCNAYFNLEWCTAKENTNHAYDTGLADSSIGENSHLAKISNKTAEKICKLIMKGLKTKEISERLGVSEKTIIHIKANEDWKRIGSKYDFSKVKKTTSLPYSHSDDDIHEVCKLLELQYSDGAISKMTGMDRRYITDIRMGDRRIDISSKYNIDRSPVVPISVEMVENVCKLLEEGKLSQGKIAKQIGISQWLVSQIYNGKRFSEISSKYKFNK